MTFPSRLNTYYLENLNFMNDFNVDLIISHG